MDLNRKILILLIILILCYILFRIVIKRFQIKQYIEGYENQDVNTIQTNYNCPVTFQNNLKTKLLNIQKYNRKEPLYLKNWSIKASLNSAFNGKGNTTDMIHYVLSRGCRFLDFEVYMFHDPNTESNSVVVSTSKDTDFIPIDKDLSVSDVLYFVNMYAFNTLCPNYDDPLFIQLRPKIRNDSNYENNKTAICSTINNAINDNLSPLYKGVINGQTSIMDLMGNFVVVMDDVNFNDCKPNINLSNNNVSVMKTYSYQNMPLQQNMLRIKHDFICDVTLINQVIFEDAKGVSYTTNVSSDYLMRNFSVQIIPMMFWNTGGDLCNYETLYNKCGGAVVPLYLIYIQLTKGTEKYIQYPDPMFAFSIYGSQTVTLFVLVASLAIVGFIAVREMT